MWQLWKLDSLCSPDLLPLLPVVVIIICLSEPIPEGLYSYCVWLWTSLFCQLSDRLVRWGFPVAGDSGLGRLCSAGMHSSASASVPDHRASRLSGGEKGVGHLGSLLIVQVAFWVPRRMLEIFEAFSPRLLCRCSLRLPSITSGSSNQDVSLQMSRQTSYLRPLQASCTLGRVTVCLGAGPPGTDQNSNHLHVL